MINEEQVKAAVRLEASRRGILLWRNNVGQLKNERGQVVRYGLCNDSKQLNKTIKSGDLIGIKPLMITQAHVGHVVGVFYSVETKHPEWKYTGTDHEIAQVNWAAIVQDAGGVAVFATKPEDIF